ncbi:MAG TPA: DUF5916 domain-containing protein [Gemmatimonadales bacterium]|jgi:hypothetical protein|nr:DUF5916 domain-containing protein [Gemmatimonadales bacterium]
MLSVLLLLVQSPPSPQQVYDGRLRQIDVRLPRIEASVKIDGVLDDPVWRQAAVLKGFTQYRPVDSRPADDSTEVLAFYAPDAIYFGIRAFEIHGNVVRATLADRDNIDADDKVQILLDTFNDRRRALLFAVNPLGAQEDGVRSEGLAGAAGGQNAGFRFDGVVDLNPDYVYQSQGHVTSWGYEVEVRIPFKSLRYQSGETQDWGVQFIRTTQHTGYEDTWTPVVRASASFLIQSGTLKALTGLRRGLVMDVSPEFTSRVDGAPSASTYRYGSVDPQVGVNVRWGLTQNLSATGTINPDFSQVEADVGQVTVNQRFALFFPEKRPFFLEGLEQFDTPNALIYTRQIQNPVGGAKLTGKVGGTAVAYIGAVDDVPIDPSGTVHSLVNLLRLRRDLGASSTLGLAYTDRSDGSNWNRVLGTDARVIWKKIWYSEGQIVGSWTKDVPGSAARAGALWDLTLYDRTGYSYGNHAELVGASPNFAALSGFVNRVNVVQGRFANRFTWYGKPGATLENATTFILVQPTWRYRDFFNLGSTLEGGINEQWLFTLRGGWGVTAHWQNNHQRFDPPDYSAYRVNSGGTLVPFAVPHGRYNLWGGDVGFNTPSRALVLTGDVGAGKGVIFSEAAEARGFNTFFTVTWKPTAGLRLDGQWTHQALWRAEDGSWFSTANIPRLKIEYQLNRAIFFRYVGQYTAQEVDALRDPRTGDSLVINGSAQPRHTSTEFRNDFLFSYRPIPGTVVFFGYGASLSEPEPFNFGRLSRTGDGFFLKASYLFRM